MSVQMALSPTDPFFTNRPFKWDGRRFTTVADFEAFLESDKTILQWAKRITVHHTWRPTVAGWLQSGATAALKGVITTWRDDNGWNRGPSLIFAPDGIYIATPLTISGIHAGDCNDDSVGVEVVGDYTYTFWQEPVASIAYGGFIALARRLGLTQDDIVNKKRINGHRECMAARTCPGAGIDLGKLRADFGAAMNATATQQDVQVIGVAQSITYEQFSAYLDRFTYPTKKMSEAEMQFVYSMCMRFDLDSAFVLAIAKHEAGEFVLGSPLQLLTNCPGNLRAASGEERMRVVHPVDPKRGTFLKYQTPQLGFVATVLHLKNEYGGNGQLSVRTILQRFAPATDGNATEAYITKTLERMAGMRNS
jgi:hypothetical protein